HRQIELVSLVVEEARRRGLRPRTPARVEDLAGIVTIPRQDPTAVVASLARRGIIVDARPGVVRLSPYFYNTPEECTRVVEAIARRIPGRSVTSVEVAEAFLKHIAVHDRLLNSFLNVMTDQALDAAQRVDDALRAGRPPGPLAGVPVAVKDLIDIAGMPTTAGAHRRFHTMAHEDAPVVTRLRDAGAIIVGKTGLHEFAYGVTNAN